MSHKDASAKQTQDYRDRFNHFDAPVLQLLGRLDSPRRFQDRFVSPTKWFRACRRLHRPGPTIHASPLFESFAALTTGPISLFSRRNIPTQLPQDCRLSLGLARRSVGGSGLRLPRRCIGTSVRSISTASGARIRSVSQTFAAHEFTARPEFSSAAPPARLVLTKPFLPPTKPFSPARESGRKRAPGSIGLMVKQ
jgi:hypothetical protein